MVKNENIHKFAKRISHVLFFAIIAQCSIYKLYYHIRPYLSIDKNPKSLYFSIVFGFFGEAVWVIFFFWDNLLSSLIDLYEGF